MVTAMTKSPKKSTKSHLPAMPIREGTPRLVACCNHLVGLWVMAIYSSKDKVQQRGHFPLPLGTYTRLLLLDAT